MKIAVIGTGAAAYGVVRALQQHPDAGAFEVTLFGPDAPRPDFPQAGKDPRKWTPDEFDALHRQLKDLATQRWPPPRTQYGSVLDECTPDPKETIYRTDYFGGLGDFWSTAVFPFREDNFKEWPIDHSDMAPYYERVAADIGIAGDPGAYREVFGETFANREAITQTPLARHFAESIRDDRDPAYRLAAGPNHLAAETRPGEPNACVYCGGCFYGCFNNSLFRPGARLRREIAAQRLSHVAEKVSRAERTKTGRVRLHLAGGTTKGYDKVFLSAGAIGSSEILLRSLDLRDTDVFVDDNEMYNFPIAYHGRKSRRFTDHFPISTNVVSMMPSSPVGGTRYGHLQILALPNLLFDYYGSKRFADRLRGPIRGLQGRFLIAQMYVDGATAARYALRLNARGDLWIRSVRTHASDFRARRQIQAIARNLEGTDFKVVPFPISRVSSSYHYAGGFSFRDRHLSLDESCEIFPGFFACDSVVFPHSPAQPLTFTIMANAMRVTTRAMG